MGVLGAVWREQSGVWGVECGAKREQCGVWSVERNVWRVECGNRQDSRQVRDLPQPGEGRIRREASTTRTIFNFREAIKKI